MLPICCGVSQPMKRTAVWQPVLRSWGKARSRPIVGASGCSLEGRGYHSNVYLYLDIDTVHLSPETKLPSVLAFCPDKDLDRTLTNFEHNHLRYIRITCYSLHSTPLSC